MLNCPFCLNNENGKCSIFHTPVNRMRNEIDCPFISMTKKQWATRLAIVLAFFAIVIGIVLWAVYKLLSTSALPLT